MADEDGQDEAQENQEEAEESQEESKPEQTESEAPKEETQEETEPEVKGYDNLSTQEKQQVKDLSDEELTDIVSKLKPDKDGTVDLKEVVRVLSQENNRRATDTARKAAEETYLGMRAEERAWDEVFEKYPDVKSNRELFNLVQAAQYGEKEYVTPLKAAEKLFKYVGTKQEEATKNAQESVRVQQAAHLETAGVQGGDTNASALQEQMSSRDAGVARSARESYIKAQIEKGNISITPQ